MLTDRSPLLCHFPKFVDFSPISCTQLPKSLIIISLSGANLYISQILAESPATNIYKNVSSSTSKDRVFIIDEALAMFLKAEISMNQNSLSLLVLSFILFSRHFRLCFTLFKSIMYMWRSSFAMNSFLVELKIGWKRNEKVLSSLKIYKENNHDTYCSCILKWYLPFLLFYLPYFSQFNYLEVYIFQSESNIIFLSDSLVLIDGFKVIMNMGNFHLR